MKMNPTPDLEMGRTVGETVQGYLAKLPKRNKKEKEKTKGEKKGNLNEIRNNRDADMIGREGEKEGEIEPVLLKSDQH
jgi:hypothetical protein